MLYETLLKEAEQHGIDTYEKPMKSSIKGLYCDRVIWINSNIATNAEKACTIAEEIGHYHTSCGNILDQKDIRHRKQEKLARTWAYKRIIPISKIVQAYKQGIRDRYELIDYLGVTEEFLESALKRYQEKYGLSVRVGNFIIKFEPLNVLELLD